MVRDMPVRMPIVFQIDLRGGKSLENSMVGTGLTIPENRFSVAIRLPIFNACVRVPSVVACSAVTQWYADLAASVYGAVLMHSAKNSSARSQAAESIILPLIPPVNFGFTWRALDNPGAAFYYFQ
jgi:hypothetical protein